MDRKTSESSSAAGAHIQAGPHERRKRLSYIAGATLLACALLLLSTTIPKSHADNPSGISSRTTQSGQESEQPQPDRKQNRIASQRRSLSIPKPAPARSNDLPAVFHKPTPESLDDLKTMERYVKAIVPRLSPAVVAVQIGASSGSGVVISQDGVVLTAAHVCDEPNRDVRFIFPDGKTARGKTLGTNHEVDAGMMKITSDGPWPYVEMGDLGQARLGDWVLTLGHPGGFDPERSLVVRLGRIIRLAPDALQTDCTLTAGDSGGPLFDMRGRVIGIHSRISASTAENFHISIRSYRDTWDRLANAENWGGEKPSPRPWFGVRGTNHPAGCKLEFVEEDAPASKAGLKVGDVVRKVNAHEVKDYATLKRFVAEAKPGDELTVELQRAEKEMTFIVKVEARRWRQ